jgi:3'(2'), 5'-bisphosphate nucleotidase
MSPTDIELARQVAADAGRLLREIRDAFGPVDPDDKPRLKQLRDTADRDSNALIMAALRQARPGDAILSEEDVDSSARLEAARVWIVDPLDGTWEYGQGRSDWGVHVALWCAEGQRGAGRLTATVVDLPAMGLVRTTHDSDPALPGLPSDRPYRVVVSRTRPPADIEAIVQRWAGLLGHQVEVVNVGSVGAKVEEILAGRAEAYLHDTGFREWDLAAPMGVAQHYGLVVEHIDGAPIALNQMPPWVPSVLITRPDLAQTLRQAVQG